jgi:hypothetical protein
MVPVQVKSGVQTLVLSLTLRQPSILETDRLSSQLRAPQLLGYFVIGSY